MTPAVVFDLDSTLADTRHRQWMIKPKGERTDWEAYSLACVDDTPIEATIRLAEALCGSHVIFIVTGRSEAARMLTEVWLARHSVPHAGLFMRPAGDRTPNAKFKLGVLENILRNYEVDFWVDDYDAVAEAMREHHPEIPVLIVNPGYHGAEGA